MSVKHLSTLTIKCGKSVFRYRNKCVHRYTSSYTVPVHIIPIVLLYHGHYSTSNYILCIYIQYIRWYITCINMYVCVCVYTACIYTCHGVTNRKMKQKYIREGIKRRSNPKSSRLLSSHSTHSRGQLYT